MPEPVANETGFVPGDGIETGTPEVSSDTAPDVLAQGRDFTNALFGRISQNPPPEQESEPVAEGSEQTPSPESTGSVGRSDSAPVAETTTETPTEETQPFRTFQTEEEWNRALQSEVDRRESARANRNRQQQNKDKLEQLRRTGNLNGFVSEYDRQQQEEVQEQQRQELTQSFRNEALIEAANYYDTGVLDPIMEMLPENERDSLIEAVNPVGIEGRATVLKSAVGRLIQKAKEEGRLLGAADAEKALRNNAAFRKQILLEGREAEEEPELIQSQGRPPAPTDMNQFIDNLLPGRRRRAG